MTAWHDRMMRATLAGGAMMLALAGCQTARDAATAVAVAPVASAQAVPVLIEADPDMRSLLLALQAQGPKPIETLSAEEARRQPSIADAVRRVQEERGLSTAPRPVARVRDVSIAGPGGPIPARVYVPEGRRPFPVIVYYHGGGWVLADLDTYDASARALASEVNAVVISADYRKGPEHKFPAAHEDAFAAYGWALKNARTYGGDPARIAVVGESAGGNLAINVARLARQHGTQVPLHEVLIYPIAGGSTDTPSYRENENAKPLNKAMMVWFFDKYLRGPGDAREPMIDLVNAPDLADLPPTTIVTAEIDPLRSDGQMLADRLRAAGVPVEAMDYTGVTHEFFGTAPLVAKATEAQSFVSRRLRQAFAAGS